MIKILIKYNYRFTLLFLSCFEYLEEGQTEGVSEGVSEAAVQTAEVGEAGCRGRGREVRSKESGGEFMENFYL